MRRRDEGIALLLVLLVLLVLILVVGAMALSVRHDRSVSENHLADLQNSYGVRSAYLQAALRLEQDSEKAADVDHLGEGWALPLEFPLGTATVKSHTADVERFLNLAALVDEQGAPVPKMVDRLRRLVILLRHPADTVERIVDYVDVDSKGAFETRARNGRFLAPEELLRVDGLAPEVLYGGLVGGDERKGLLDFVTVWPRTPIAAAPGMPGAPPVAPPPAAPPPPGTPPPAGDGTTPPPAAPAPTAPPILVNVNTASAEVLASLSDRMTLQAAQALVAARLRPGPDGRPEGIKKLEDLKSVPGITGEVYDSLAEALTVKSSLFEIRAQSTVGNIEKSWVYVVQRSPGAEEGAPSKLKLLSQQRLNDFLTIRPPAQEEE